MNGAKIVKINVTVPEATKQILIAKICTPKT